MSEYQYYEFRAIDRPLTKEQMAELRAISSRAEITPTRFANFYTYGDFKGDERELIERYFDAHVYVANWGSHVLMFGVPRSVLDLDALTQYEAECGFSVQVRGERAILTFERQDEDGGGRWVEEDEGETWMASLIPLRADLMNGDLRAAYLGWLAGVQYGAYVIREEDDDDEDEIAKYGLDPMDLANEPGTDDDREPPVPAGLGSLTASLQSLADFLELDPDLVAVAAERSASARSFGPSGEELLGWLAGLSTVEKDRLLLRVMQGDARPQSELLLAFRRQRGPRSQEPSADRRTVRALLETADRRREERKRQEAEAARQERARRLEEAARARDLHLRSLRGREESIWTQVEAAIATKQPKQYDAAVTLLKDLRDLAAREGDDAAFGTRLAQLRIRHEKKPSLIDRLDKAGLRQRVAVD